MNGELNHLLKLLQLAIEEDVGSGDITSDATIDADAVGKALIRAKQRLIVAGMDVLPVLWEQIDPKIRVTVHAEDGQHLQPRDVLAECEGNVRSLLRGERLCLNLLAHLCGIATFTEKFVRLVGGGQTKILDTRKTLPGLRVLEKAAVRAGGGHNHRFGLYDQVLIKDNHVQACGGVAAAVGKAKTTLTGKIVEVEVRNESELNEAIEAGANIILLDNMSIDQIRRCVQITSGRAELEVSGGVGLKEIPDLVEAGVDRISIGALTHSAWAADLHMKIESVS